MPMTRVGHCRQCRPEDWPASARDHYCAANDEDRLYGTIVYSRPRHSGALHDRYWVHEWPLCEQCGEEYCTHCGELAWHQGL